MARSSAICGDTPQAGRAGGKKAVVRRSYAKRWICGALCAVALSCRADWIDATKQPYNRPFQSLRQFANAVVTTSEAQRTSVNAVVPFSDPLWAANAIVEQNDAGSWAVRIRLDGVSALRLVSNAFGLAVQNTALWSFVVATATSNLSQTFELRIAAVSNTAAGCVAAITTVGGVSSNAFLVAHSALSNSLYSSSAGFASNAAFASTAVFASNAMFASLSGTSGTSVFSRASLTSSVAVVAFESLTATLSRVTLTSQYAFAASSCATASVASVASFASVAAFASNTVLSTNLFVQKSGDTMTGTLTVPSLRSGTIRSLTITGRGNATGLVVDAGRITAPDDDNIDLQLPRNLWVKGGDVGELIDYPMNGGDVYIEGGNPSPHYGGSRGRVFIRGAVGGVLNMGGNTISNLPNPTLSHHAATKGYVDATCSGYTGGISITGSSSVCVLYVTNGLIKSWQSIPLP